MIIICTKNAEDRIDFILEPIKKIPVLLVDCSTDNTRKIAKRYLNVKIIRDAGKGLASARNKAISYLKKQDKKFKRFHWIMFQGDDNIVYTEEIDKAIRYMKDNNFVGVGLKTYTKDETYLQKAINKRWSKKFKIGRSDVIGTPSIWEWDVIKRYKFDEKCQDADDADLCLRLRRDGLFVGYAPAHCLDLTEENYKTIKSRYLRYGKSDAEYYDKHSIGWDWKRKVKSWCHPLVAEKVLLTFKYWPVYLMLVFFRYIGWIKWSR